MKISLQYLEGGPDAAVIAPELARARLHEAFLRLPISMVLLGWDHDAHLVEAIAAECAQHAAALYLWQPILTGHGDFRLRPDWRVVNLHGGGAPGTHDKPEFTFYCPNRPEVRESALRKLTASIEGALYLGVFLDRIRFPSPASDFPNQFGCFCEACWARAHEDGLDINEVKQVLLDLERSDVGRRAIASALLAAHPVPRIDGEVEPLRQMLEFRQRSITRFVGEIGGAARSRGLQVGLDCFSPSLCRMVGQDIPSLGACSDWVKVMTYVRAFAPASIPYEIMGLVDWLVSTGGETAETALDFVAEATGWELPRSAGKLWSGRLPSAILTEELCRARSANPPEILAGMELVDLPGITDLSVPQISADAQAIKAAKPDGVVLCWDMWHIPVERLELAGLVFGE